MSESLKRETERKVSIEKQTQYNNKYYEKNKQNILNKCKEKKLCTGCNKMISKSNFSKHVKHNACVLIVDQEQIKQDRKIKKIIELNEYITQMNNLYETNVNLIDIPE
jgi:hypothetical protein